MAPPTSKLSRLARMASLGARVGAAKARGLFGSSSPEASIARATQEVLGQMRGLALKAGQMVSYIDGFVPEAHQQTYENALAVLRDAVPPMSPDAAVRVVREELGTKADLLLAGWDSTPIASASLGQVHRSRLPDGREVAVKVQYEEIAKAVESDLQLSSVARLLGPIGRKLALGDQLAEMRARFTEELDYRHEARAQEDFAALFARESKIRIPKVFPEFSARRVLTQELAQGLRFEAACRASVSDRRTWAALLWRFAFESLLQGLFNADPHPGNYLFEQGAVWFLDFGCSKRLPGELVERIRATHRAASSLDREGFLAAARKSVGAPKSADHARRMDDYFLLCFDPLLTPGPYRITRAYARKLLDEMRANFFVLLKGSTEDYAPLPPDVLFLNRLQLGFYSVLARLDVEVDYHAVELELVEKFCAA